MKRFKRGFTLAEVLITLAIIGVVAAISIPSVISNSQQQEFKTGLRKAVSVLNSAITMNMAIDGESPYDNRELFNYLQRHMSVIKTTNLIPWRSKYRDLNGNELDKAQNTAFYTTDGMRFEFDDDAISPLIQLKLHESDTYACFPGGMRFELSNCAGCGSYGLDNNVDGTTKPPCFIVVDVNGDRKPYPKNASCTTTSCAGENLIKAVNPDSKLISDMFTIMITDKAAIPFGVVAQKAMYQAQDKK